MIHTRTIHALKTSLTDDRAQALVEYALIIVVVTLGTLVALTFLRDQLMAIFSETGNLL
jgi:Flp pilus assembly pilin Flp